MPEGLRELYEKAQKSARPVTIQVDVTNLGPFVDLVALLKRAAETMEAVLDVLEGDRPGADWARRVLSFRLAEIQCGLDLAAAEDRFDRAKLLPRSPEQ